METGTIAKLNEKGYGFISIEGQEKDIFFHSNELKDVEFDNLNEGDRVQFEITDSPKGQNATSVTRTE